MTCPDWMASLRPASYGGVHFWVDRDEVTVGRRLVVHEFPNRDRPFVEDLGEKAITYQVTAYVASDSVIAEKNALLGVCRRRGARNLVLPTEGSQRVRCKSARRTHEKDRLGYIAFALEFVEAGVGMSAAALPLLERAVAAALPAAVDAIAAAFLRSYSTVRQADFVISDAVSMAQGWAEVMDGVRAQLHMTPIAKAQLGRLISDYHLKAETLARDGLAMVDVRRTSLGLGTTDAPTADLVRKASEIMQAITDGVVDDVDAFEAFEDLSKHQRGEIEWAAYGASGQQAVANRAALHGAYRRLALAHMAVVGAAREWPDRSHGTYARATIAELFDAELGAISLGAQEYQVLSSMRNKAAQAISDRIADLDPIVTVEASAVEPALVWAWRLYEDASQASSLAQRNAVNHPGFMPTEFQALTPVGDDTSDHASDRRRRAGG